MYAYYRSTQYSTATSKILRGSFTDVNESDLVLVKGCSLEHFRVTPLSKNNRTILTQQFEQSTFGLINDACSLPCHFDNDRCPDSLTPPGDSDTHHTNIPYTRIQRKNHAYINGNDVIVAVSEYGRLVFWCITATNPSETKHTGRFEVLAEIILDDPGLEYKKIGKKLAVDPGSRAIAIASYQDRFDIMILNTHMSRNQFKPIVGMGSFEEQGIIWHMEFLHTEMNSMDRIVLVTVIYNDVEHIPYVIAYAINASNPKQVSLERIGKLSLENYASLPVMLIPISFQPETLMLALEKVVCVLTTKDIAEANDLHYSGTIPKFSDGETSLLTCYAIPPDQSFLYLGSAEGKLYKVELAPANTTVWKNVGDVCPMGLSMQVLGTVFIDVDGQGYMADAILCIGEGANSEVVAIGHSSLACTRLQSLINLAPLTDCQVIHDTNAQRSSIVACCGQNDSGSLSYISRGVQANLLLTFYIGWNRWGCMWDISTPEAGTAENRLLVSLMAGTKVFKFNDSQLKDITESIAVNSQQKTVFASSFSLSDKSLIIQVYGKGILLTSPVDSGRDYHYNLQHMGLDSDCEILFATTFVSNETQQAAICTFSRAQYTIHLVEFVQDSSLPRIPVKVNASLNMDEVPSYLGSFNIRCDNGNRSILVVGTYAPALHIYNIHQTHLEHLQSKNLSSVSLFAVPHSVAIIWGPSSGLPRHLIVGLRQGMIITFEMDDSFQKGGRTARLLRDKENICELDSHAVFLIPQKSQEGSVLALSKCLWRISCDNDFENLLGIDPVLLPNYDTVYSVLPIDMAAPYRKNDTIAILADKTFQFFEMDASRKLASYNIKLGETPRRVLYNTTAKKAIIATLPNDKSLKSALHVVDISKMLNHSEFDDISVKTMIIKRQRDFMENDKILSVADWTFNHRGKVFKYFCIGVSQPGDRSAPNHLPGDTTKKKSERGCFQIYRLEIMYNNEQPDNKMAQEYVLHPVWRQGNLPGGVSTMCPHPEGILVSAGATLFLFRMDPSKNSLSEVTHRFLRYPITSVTLDGARICITAHTDSVAFYTYRADTNKIEFLASDSAARTVHHALMLDNRTVVAASISGGMMVLYDESDDETLKQCLQTAFSFHFSEIIIKPNLFAIRPHQLLRYLSAELGTHILPWTGGIGNIDSSLPAEPIVGCTVAGGVVTVHRISSILYNVLLALQERLLNFGPTSPLLGSARVFLSWYSQLSGEGKNTIHGDLIALYLRLTTEQQQQVVGLQNTECHRNLVEAVRTFSDASTEMDVPKIAKILYRLIHQLEKYI